MRADRCLCPDCTDAPAPTYTPAYKRACLVASLAARPAAAIRAFLMQYAAHHGAEARERLRAEVAEQWRAGSGRAR